MATRVAARDTVKSTKPKPSSKATSNTQALRSGKAREEALVAPAPPQTFSHPASQAKPCNESPTQVSSLKRPSSNDLSDQEMTNLPDLSARSKIGTQPDEEHPTAGVPTPNAKPLFGIPERKGTQGKSLEANNNPFASPGEESREAGTLSKPPVETTEGWVFQGKRRHAPILASPKQEAPQSPLHTPQKEATPGGKRGLMHSEVHPSFFTSLGIPAPPNKKPFKGIWPVLIREKNA